MSKIPIEESTDVIVGGGKFVEWTKYDNNELTFLLDDKPEKKYLNFEVFDQDIGTDDRSLGRVPIRLESVTQENKQYYARVDIFQGKKWAGQLDIGAKLIKYDNSDDNDVLDAKEQEMNEKYGKHSDFKYKLLVTVFSADNLEDVDHSVSEEENFWKFVKGVVVFASYLCVGALIFSWIEGTSFGFMLWFFIVSTCTVGYGDWAPATTAGHLINSVAIICNLFVFAWAFSVTFSYIYARQEALLRKGGQAHSLLDFATTYFVGFSKKLDTTLKETVVAEKKKGAGATAAETVKNSDKDKNNNGNDTESNISIQRARSMSKTAQELEAKREVKEQEQKEQEEFLDGELKKGVLINLALLGGLVVAGTLFFAALNYEEAIEQEAYFEAAGWPKYYILDPVRFTIMTMTTVGYGDMYPQTPGGKVFGSFYLIVGVSFLTRIVGSVFEIIATKREQEQKKRTMTRALLSSNAMQEFDEDGSGDIDKYEFLKTMLIIRGEVGEGTIRRIMRRFEELDEDGSGEIDFADFAGATRRDTIKEQNEIAQKDRRMTRQKSVSNVDLYDNKGGTGASGTNSNAKGTTEMQQVPSEDGREAPVVEKKTSNVESPNDAVSSDTEDVAEAGHLPTRTETDKEMLGIGKDGKDAKDAEDSAQQYKD